MFFSNINNDELIHLYYLNKDINESVPLLLTILSEEETWPCNLGMALNFSI